MPGLMEWYLVLFLAGHMIEVPGEYVERDKCISAGQQTVEQYKRYHPHSSAWFWCYEGAKT